MRPKSEKGQAMVEFALVLPILLLILCGIIDFSWVLGNQLMANNAAREAARYTAIHYYNSNTDNDETQAAEIVAQRAPTLASPTVALSVSGGAATVNISSNVNILTPIIAKLFPGGKYLVRAECTMRLE